MSAATAINTPWTIALASRGGVSSPPQVVESWANLIHGNDVSILSNDVTVSPEWATALYRAFTDPKEQFTLAAQDETGAVTGVFPMFRRTIRLHGFIRCHDVAPVTDIHAGRSGFCLAAPHPHLAQELLNGITAEGIVWDRFHMTVVAGSESDAMLERFAHSADRRVHLEVVQKSPYMELPTSWETFWNQRDGKFRAQLRNRERKLRLQGHLDYKVVETVGDVEWLLGAIKAVERDSWKHEAGSSIERDHRQVVFYDVLLPLAAKRGWLSGHVLTMESEPIAYLLGLRCGRQFSGLKHSFNARYRDVGAGNLIQMMTIRTLIEQGVASYDFMGNFEPHKKVWTDKTYQRKRFTIYNDTTKARFAWAVGRLRSGLALRDRASRRSLSDSPA